MTLLGLVVLAALWLAVLAPTWRRKQAQFKASDSIGDFHSHLQALARRSTTLVPPPNVMRARSAGFVEPAELGLVPTPPVQMPPGQMPQGEIAQGEIAQGEIAQGEMPPSQAGALARPRRSSAARPQPPIARSGPSRQQVLRRRRQVLSALLALVLSLLALGFLPNLQLLWSGSAVAALLVGGYMSMLVHVRTAAHWSGRRSVAAGRQLHPGTAERRRSMSFPSPSDAPGLLRRSVGS